MIPTTEQGTTHGTSDSDTENKDPFVATPPRKECAKQEPKTPATPISTSTPLHKRFLDEVAMSPGTPCTPPRTPSRSPERGSMVVQTPRQTLEVGQNGFYFSMEIPEKKITPRRAATPDTKLSAKVNTGRLTPSPKKPERSEVKTGGRVRDILRKNLFGSPTKQIANSARGSLSPQKLQPRGDDISMSPAKGSKVAVDGSESESVLPYSPKEGAIGDQTTSTTSLTSTTLPSLATSTAATTLTTSNHPIMSQELKYTPKTQASTPMPTVGETRRNTPAITTPFNIGQLMANHSNKGAKVHTLPDTTGAESMPTPLRKMSERLGLRSPHVLRKDKIEGSGKAATIIAIKDEALRAPISALNFKAPAPRGSDGTSELGSSPQRGSMGRKGDRLVQALPSLITTLSPVFPLHPGSAAMSSFPSPSTPSRPGLPRAKSFGTPARLRSSIQEDMFKVQESLKRSLGPDVFQASSSRPTTPMSPSVAFVEQSPTVATARSRSHLKGASRPVSMIEPATVQHSSSAQAVPRRPLNTAARKPRPKSMIAGSAKILETVAAGINSPRERAKQRSAAAASAPKRPTPPSSRPGTATSTSRNLKPATTSAPPPKPHPTVRTTKSAALRAAAHSKPTAPSITRPTQPGPAHKVATNQAPKRRTTQQKDTANESAPSRPLTRAKSVKAPTKPPPPPPPPPHKQPTTRTSLKTPEPHDTRSDSGTAQSYTPPGNPTRLPSPVKSPSKPRLVAAQTPTPVAPCPTVAAAAAAAPPPPAALAAPPPPTNQHTPVEVAATKRLAHGTEANALRTPSKAVQRSLDAAIDRKIEEDRRRRDGWF